MLICEQQNECFYISFEIRSVVVFEVYAGDNGNWHRQHTEIRQRTQTAIIVFVNQQSEPGSSSQHFTERQKRRTIKKLVVNLQAMHLQKAKAKLSKLIKI